VGSTGETPKGDGRRGWGVQVRHLRGMGGEGGEYR